MDNEKVWINKLIEYCKTGRAGSCPICGSTNFKAEELNYGRKSINFVCSDCGSWRHFDSCVNNIQKVNKKGV